MNYNKYSSGVYARIEIVSTNNKYNSSVLKYITANNIMNTIKNLELGLKSADVTYRVYLTHSIYPDFENSFVDELIKIVNHDDIEYCNYNYLKKKYG